ncbi:SPOR domain-containing protein [Brevundimonas subvibrioides]|uniref:SPOR domain-containing protein n=1 Tax=Brevundimonas subvibrioides TaxID=74313 RepID=UPI0022B42183|nr:SPOR domain-containing protein [Brevundimonas subvibrioides]
MLRPVLLGLAGLSTVSCGVVESDPHRFESMAQAVASVPLDGSDAPVRTAAELGLRPARIDAAAVANPGALRVEVMDPHALWDARDAGLRGAVEQAAPVMIEAAAPVVTRAVRQQVSDRSQTIRPTRAVVVEPVHAGGATGPRETLQLGAFSSPSAARAAWSRIRAAGHGLAGLTPAFEAVEVDGRTLTRLKVTAAGETVRAVCRAADAADLGCLRRG